MDVDDVGFALLTLISERALLLKEREALLFERGRAASQFIGAAEVIKDIESSIASKHYERHARWPSRRPGEGTQGFASGRVTGTSRGNRWASARPIQSSRCV